MASQALRRYVLFQTPGWAAAAVLGWSAWHFLEWPAGLCALAFTAWLVKDAVLFPFVRRSYEDQDAGDARISVGDRAIATEDIAPEGFVRVGSELWRAELAPGAPPVRRGEPVRVREVRGLRLVVEAEPR